MRVAKTGGNQAGAPWAQLPPLTGSAPGFGHSLKQWSLHCAGILCKRRASPHRNGARASDVAIEGEVATLGDDGAEVDDGAERLAVCRIATQMA